MVAKDQRRCVSCRRLAHRTEFWRVVRLAGSRQVVWDRQEPRLQGRAAYLCPCAACLTEAQKKRRLERALKTPIPPTLWPQWLDQLAAPCSPPQQEPRDSHGQATQDRIISVGGAEPKPKLS